MLVLRSLAVAVMAAVLSAVPVGRIAACDCAQVELRDAVRQADVAFVGRLVERAPGGDNFGLPVLDEWRWSVEKGRDAGSASQIVVYAEWGDGANCGVSFAAHERWLVLASVHEGRLQTNGCARNQRLDGDDPEAEAAVAGLVTVDVRPSPGPQAGWFPPSAVIVAILAVVGVGTAAAVAFRRGNP